jgi:hypothetical protein
VLDLRIAAKKLKGKLPDIKTLDLSLNSVPVLITIGVIALLLISVLANFVRKSKDDEPEQATKMEAVVEQTDELRMVVNPPEPYYK